ncbi:hypothetical protein EGW08_023635, partial [Elysia chlorotica]
MERIRSTFIKISTAGSKILPIQEEQCDPYDLSVTGATNSSVMNNDETNKDGRDTNEVSCTALTAVIPSESSSFCNQDNNHNNSFQLIQKDIDINLIKLYMRSWDMDFNQMIQKCDRAKSKNDEFIECVRVTLEHWST